jgi:hypothetical protein
LGTAIQDGEHQGGENQDGCENLHSVGKVESVDSHGHEDNPEQETAVNASLRSRGAKAVEAIGAWLWIGKRRSAGGTQDVCGYGKPIRTAEIR